MAESFNEPCRKRLPLKSLPLKNLPLKKYQSNLGGNDP